MKNVVFSNKVYNKDFKIKAVGYDCQEVDTFLDEINIEIVKLEREISALKETKNTLETSKQASEQKIKELQYENSSLKAQSNVASSSNANLNNITMLNRLSALEVSVKKILEKLENQ